LVGKLGVKRSLGDRILKWILKELGCNVVAWIQMAQNREQWHNLVNMVKNLQFS